MFCCLQYEFIRAVPAGLVSPVSPVSTGPLFDPHSWLCLAFPISAIAWRTPTQYPKAHRYHVETCKMAVNSATELFHKSSEGCGFRPISKLNPWKGDGVRQNGQNGIHVKLCRLASKKHRIGPNLVSEAIS